MAPDRSLFLSPLDEPRRGATPPPRGSPTGPGPRVGTRPAGDGRSHRRSVFAVVVVLGLAAVAANRAAPAVDPAPLGDTVPPAESDPAGADQQDAAGQDATGQDETGQDSAGQDSAGRRAAGDDAAGEGDADRDETARDDEGTASTGPTGVGGAPSSTLQTTAVLGPLFPEATGTTVVVVTGRNQLLLAHLDSGTVRTVEVPGLEPGFGHPGGDVVRALGPDMLLAGSALVARRPNGAVTDIEASFDSTYPSAVDGRFWSLAGSFSELVERDRDGETGRRVALPVDTGPILPMGDSFIVSPYGSVLQLDAATGRALRLADGVAVAADASTLVRVRCDESLDCGLTLSDLVGGDERVVATPTPRSWYETYAGGELSPDGRYLAIPFYGVDQPGGIVLVDVERGERLQLDSLATSSGGGFPDQTAFTADSRWLLRLDGFQGELKAIRIDDGLLVDIDLDLPRSRERGMLLFSLSSVPSDVDPVGG